MRIVFVMTCHNRVEHTLACLASIYGQDVWGEHAVDIVLVDDASSDGTAAKVAARFPDVEILHGDGNLFWAGGMRKAFAAALQSNADHYVWINDDTILDSNAMGMLLKSAAEVVASREKAVIVVGPTRDPDTGTTSYSGWRRKAGLNRGAFEKVPPSGSLVACNTFNANCVLISSVAAERVGNLDPAFTHSMGDFDYGLRAERAGCALTVAPQHVGCCRLNMGIGSWTDPKLPLAERWKRLRGPKGLPPREWLVFTRRHHGSLWFLYWLNPYLKFWFRGIRDTVIHRSS